MRHHSSKSVIVWRHIPVVPDGIRGAPVGMTGREAGGGRTVSPLSQGNPPSEGRARRGCGGDGRALRRRRDGHPVPSAAPGRFPPGKGLLCKKGRLCSRPAALSFLIVRSNFFSIAVVFSRSFPPFCRALSRIRQTGLSTRFFSFCTPSKRPNPAETLETCDSGWPQKQFRKEMFPYTLRAAGNRQAGRADRHPHPFGFAQDRRPR